MKVSSPNCHRRSNERGYTMVMVLVLMALTAFVVREALKRTATSSTIIEKTRTLTADTVDVEGALNKVIAHMQSNSAWYSYLFSKDTFYVNFARADAPYYGENDNSSSQVLTMLMMVESGYTPLLNNDTALFGSEQFPESTDPQNGSSHDLKGDLSDIDFEAVKVRLTLVGANPEDPAGDTPPTPTTDFRPVFRIDAMSGLAKGPHIYALIEGFPVLTEVPVGDGKGGGGGGGDVIEVPAEDPPVTNVVTDMLFRVRQITTAYR